MSAPPAGTCFLGKAERSKKEDSKAWENQWFVREDNRQLCTGSARCLTPLQGESAGQSSARNTPRHFPPLSVLLPTALMEISRKSRLPLSLSAEPKRNVPVAQRSVEPPMLSIGTLRCDMDATRRAAKSRRGGKTWLVADVIRPSTTPTPSAPSGTLAPTPSPPMGRHRGGSDPSRWRLANLVAGQYLPAPNPQRHCTKTSHSVQTRNIRNIAQLPTWASLTVRQ